MQYKTGLIVGRFQPFHKGHLHLVQKALEQAEELIIVVGSTNKRDERNPYSFKEREKQIKNSLKKQKLLQKVKQIVPQPDDPDDDIWFQNLKEKIGEFDIAFGNNEWVNGILENAGFKVIRIPLHERDKYEGTKIRKELKKAKSPQEFLKKHLP